MARAWTIKDEDDYSDSMSENDNNQNDVDLIPPTPWQSGKRKLISQTEKQKNQTIKRSSGKPKSGNHK